MNVKDLLPESFYARDTAAVARELLGKYLLRAIGGDLITCRIVETEAYYGQNDAASHASRGPTPRSAIMFGPPGRAYVYFNYGVHYLLNIVTEPAGTAGAVLIRALEPVGGIEVMRRNRPVSELKKMTNGPGKLTQALKISLRENGHAVFGGPLAIQNVEHDKPEIVSARRVGISAGKELFYRFYIKDNLFVSKK